MRYYLAKYGDQRGNECGEEAQNATIRDEEAVKLTKKL